MVPIRNIKIGAVRFEMTDSESPYALLEAPTAAFGLKRYSVLYASCDGALANEHKKGTQPPPPGTPYNYAFMGLGLCDGILLNIQWL